MKYSVIVEFVWLQVEKGLSESQLILKTPIDDSYEEEEAGEMVIVIDKVRKEHRWGEERCAQLQEKKMVIGVHR